MTVVLVFKIMALILIGIILYLLIRFTPRHSKCNNDCNMVGTCTCGYMDDKWSK